MGQVSLQQTVENNLIREQSVPAQELPEGHPVPYTCPLIDSIQGSITHAINSVKDLRGTLENYKPYIPEELGGLLESCNDTIDEVINILWEKDDEMEEIRDANSGLRVWAAENANAVVYLMGENELLKEELNKYKNGRIK